MGGVELNKGQETHVQEQPPPGSAPAPAQPSSHRTTWIVGIVGAVLVGGIGIAWLALHRGDKDDPSGAGEPGQSRNDLVRVEVVRPQMGGVERTVTRPASIHSFDYAVLYAQASGYLTKQVVDIGDVVKKGQLLAEIDAPELWANVEKARADLAKARANVGVMQARLEVSEAQVKEARSQVEQAKTGVQRYTALVTLRKAQYRRIYRLWKLNSIQEELVDEAKQAQEAAEAQVVDARQAVITAQSHVQSTEATVKQAGADLTDAQAKVKVAQAMLKRAQALAEFTRIKSPYGGVITMRAYQLGDFIRNATEGETQPMLTVARTDLMRVITYLPDPDVPFARRGRKARLVVDSLPDHPFEGVLARTAASEDYNTRTMRVEMDVPNPKDKDHPNGLLKNGMYGEMTVYLGRTRRGVSIPSAALVGPEKDGMRAVYVVRDGKAEHVEVRLGLDDGIRVEALSGLKESDLVVVRHGPGLRPGRPVRVVEQVPSRQVE